MLLHSTCVNSLIPSKTGKTPSQIKNQHVSLSAGRCRVGQGLPHLAAGASRLDLGPGSLASLVLPCGSAPGCRSSPQHSAPAPGSRATTLNTYDPARHRKATLGRGQGGKGGCWPEEPGLSRGWLCPEAGVRSRERRPLGCVWRWGACRAPQRLLLAHTRELTCPNRDPGCQAGGRLPGVGHMQRDQRVVVLGRAAVIAESPRD